MRQEKAMSLLGIAAKAGRVAGGGFLAEQEVKRGRAALVIVAEDASENTKKKFRNLCGFYKVPICFYQDKDSLGHAVGKEARASLAVLDKGLGGKIEKLIREAKE